MVKQMVDRWDFRQMLIGKLCTPSTSVICHMITDVLGVQSLPLSHLSHDHSCHMITAVTWSHLSHDHTCHIVC